MATRTESALVAVFGTRSDAEAAAGDLVRNGFAGDHIHIVSDTQSAASGYGSVEHPSPGHDERNVKHWFESVFGEDSKTERERYEQGVREGRAVVGLSTPNQMVDTAAEILSHHSPVEASVKQVAQHGYFFSIVSRFGETLRWR